MKTDQEPQPPVQRRRFAQRGIGVVMVIASGVLAYLCIILPMQAAAHHEEGVSISMEGVAFVPALFAIGLILIFMGDKPSQTPDTGAEPPVLMGIVCVVMVVIGILLYEWLKSRLREYGYGD